MASEVKVCFLTLTNGDYWKGTATLIESIRKKSGLSLGDYQFYIYTDKKVPTSTAKWVEDRPEQIQLIVSDALQLITATENLGQPHWGAALKKLALIGEEHVPGALHILIDSDMICLGRLDEIQRLEPYRAAPDALYSVQDSLNRCNDGEYINSGFFPFKPSMDVRNRLIKLYKMHPTLPDQDIFNIWLNEVGIDQRIGSQWNCLKSVFRNLKKTDREKILHEIKFLHFISGKPWDSWTSVESFEKQSGMLRLELVWWDYFHKSGLIDSNFGILRKWIHPLLRYTISFCRWKIMRSIKVGKYFMKTGILWFLLKSPARSSLEFISKKLAKVYRIGRPTLKEKSIREEVRRLASKNLFKSEEVLSGPFIGMKFNACGSSRGHHWPLFLGSYEQELHEVIETLRGEPLDCILDVGCAEGYYAIGFAKMFPEADVYAFDIDESSREICKRIASINGVADRVSVRDWFDASSIDDMGLELSNCLMFCDCEGFELDLFTSQNLLENLKKAYLLIELHEFDGINRPKLIKEYLRKTHSIETIKSVDDIRRPIVFSNPILSGLEYEIQKRIMSEGRGHVQYWYFCKPQS